MVPVLYGKFAEAQKAMKQANGWHAAELFHPIPRHLSSVDDGFIMSFVSKHFDITAALLGQINRTDPKESHKLFSGTTQLPLTMIMHGDLLCRGVLNFMSKNRWQQMGDRLMTAMASGSIDEDGTVHWLSCGPYDCTFQESKLAHVLHRPTGDAVVVDPNEYLVSGAWTAIDFGHELTVGFKFQKQASLVLCDTFDKVPAPLGPWKFIHCSSSKQ